jgi:hypothetical protein
LQQNTTHVIDQISWRLHTQCKCREQASRLLLYKIFYKLYYNFCFLSLFTACFVGTMRTPSRFACMYFGVCACVCSQGTQQFAFRKKQKKQAIFFLLYYVQACIIILYKKYVFIQYMYIIEYSFILFLYSLFFLIFINACMYKRL